MTDDQQALSRLARGLALVLNDSEMRLKVLRDLRDSPFPQHSIHFTSYLRGPDGQILVERIQMALELDDPRQILEGLPALQLVAPVPYHRATWEGEEAPGVIAVPSRRTGLSPEQPVALWTPQGVAVPVGLLEPAGMPILFLSMPEFKFGSTPDETRRAAPGRDRSTISPRGYVPRHRPRPTTREARVRPERESGPEVQFASLVSFPGTGSRSRSAAYPYGYAPGGPYLSADVTGPNCISPSSGDADGDGIGDICEPELAGAFRPYLWFDHAEYLVSRETYWAAKKAPFSDELSFFYALSYHDDKDHVGDSEWIWLNIMWDDPSDTWRLVSATYSAHWRSSGGEIFDHTKTYSWEDLESIDEYRGKPVSYIAQNKHANYESDAHCDNPYQECDRAFGQYTAVYTNRDLGHLTSLGPAKKIDCVDSTTGADDLGHALPGTECYWTDLEGFGGWHGYRDSGVLPYRDALEYWDDWLFYSGSDGGGSGGTCDPTREAFQC